MPDNKVSEAEVAPIENHNSHAVPPSPAQPASDIAHYRERFPLLDKKVYLNSCSQGALSTDVRQAYDTYLDDWDRLGSPWELWVERSETARNAFAGLINAHSNEVAVMTSVSAGVSALASTFDFSGERNKVVVSDFEFPTVAQLWHAQEQRGAEVVHVPAAGNIIPLERFANAIDGRTKLVSITQICYRNGSRLDVPAIVELAHSKGALVLLDSYQALGNVEVDVRQLGVDFLVGGVLKYLLSSAGLAFLYVRKELIDELFSTTGGWFSQANIFDMDIYATNPHPSARRFEAGTPPVPNIYAALAGIKLVQSVGLPKIEARIRLLTDAIKSESMRRGFNLVTPIDPDRHGAMIALRSHHVGLLAKRLEEDGIVVSHRDDNLRISPHFYNNLDDVQQLMAALTKQRDLLV